MAALRRVALLARHIRPRFSGPAPVFALSAGLTAGLTQQPQHRHVSTTANATPNGPLSGKVGLVTGSTSGIGLGVARALLGAGANVMLNGFGSQAEIEALRAELTKEFGEGRVGYSGADMAQPKQIHDMVESTVQQFGQLDFLINNVGVQHVAPVTTFPAAQWDRVLAINLSAVFHATQAALPHLHRNASGGRIINVASVHGSVGSVNKSAYVASKHGVLGLTKVVALEQANSRVTCNAIAPGWVLTPLVQAQIEQRAEKEGKTVQQAKEELLGEKQPMLEFTTPAALGGLAVFLCGPDAATITGTTLTMDGGWTAQ